MKNLKFVFSFLIMAIFTLPTFAQMPGMMGPPGGGRQAPKIGHIYGKIVDSLGKPVEFASVVLLTNKMDSATKQWKEVLLKGQATEANGDFSLSELPIFGKLTLKITALGYKDLTMPIKFEMKMDGKMTPPKPGTAPDFSKMGQMMGNMDKDLGNIKMSSDAVDLQTVTVTATKALMEMSIDKKVFNVEKNIVSTGGTAVDIMRNVPSLQVDIDGNVKLRNAAPTLFIDGRPTTLTLDQIPADAIEKVEVMTNPSAKFDASGGNAGILNLVLKKNKKSGYNGNINVGADKFGGGNAMVNFNVRQDKFNFSFMGMTNQMRNRTTGSIDRQDNINGITMETMQNIHNRNHGGMAFGRLGFDYFITNRTTLSFAALMMDGRFKPNDVTDIYQTSFTGATNYSQRVSESSRHFHGNPLQFGIKHLFPKEGEEWTMDLHIFGGKNNNNSLATTNYFTTDNAIAASKYQKTDGFGSNQFINFQSDYVKPLPNKGSLEMGVKAQLGSIKNLNNNFLKGIGAQEYVQQLSASTNYTNKNNVFAAYTSVSGKAGNAFSYKAGLRAESSFYTGNLLSTGQTFKNQYPLSFFPSIFLSKELGKGQQFQVSLTRRVNRPNFFQLIPFIDYTDSLNITRGNPDLKPEFTLSSEMSYSKSKGDNTFLATIYYKHSDNLITRYLSREINPVTGRLDLINTFVNANQSNTYGLELTQTAKPAKWWDLTANLNFYNSKINTNNLDAKSNDALWSSFAKLNNNLNLGDKWTIQLSGDFQSKTNSPVTSNQGFMGGPQMMQAQSSSQGYIKAFYGVDFAVKKTFLKNDAASISVNVNDIFRTRSNTTYSYGEGFSQSYYRLNNPQMIRVNFSYRFGKMDVSLFKRQNMKSQQEGMQNGMQNMN